MNNISEKWTAIVYDKQDKIAHRIFTGEEEAVNKEAKSWADKYFPDHNWVLHRRAEK